MNSNFVGCAGASPSRRSSGAPPDDWTGVHVKRFWAIALVLVLVVSACGGDGEDASAGDRGGDGAEEGAPVHGGKITVPVPTEPRTLDPVQEPSAFTQVAMMQMYDTLLRMDPEGLPDRREIIGSLAEDWELNDDATELTLTLREGVVFHDGEPFTSEDVRVTLERARDMPDGVGSAQAQTILAGVEVETPDDHTVVIRSEEPNPILPQALTAPALAIVPAHLVADDPHAIEREPIGTGPFKLDAWRSGSAIEVVRNEDYWNDPYPYLDGITFAIMPDLSSRTSGFVSGSIHITAQAATVPASEWEWLEQQVPGAQQLVHDGPARFVTFLNNEAEPFDDIRVRRAFAMVADQPAQGERAYDGIYTPNTYGFGIESEWALPKDELDEVPGITGVTDDHIEEAKALLAEAGYPDGLDVDYLVPEVDIYISVAEVYANQLESIGVNAKIRVLPLDTDVTPMLREGRYQMAQSAATAMFSDPCLTLNVYRSDAVVNFSKFADPEFDELHDTICREADQDARLEATHEAQRILHDQVPLVLSVNPLYVEGARPEVRGLTHPGLLQENFWYETVWLAE